MSHADIINKMVSKRMDKWRRDISEKRRKRKSKRYYIPMKRFNSKPPQKRMAKLKCSPTFSSVFLRIFQMSKTQTVSITGRRRMFASTLGRARLFTPMNSSSAKNTWISCTASASTDPRLRLCGTQTHLFSAATKVYDAKCFFVATRKEMPRQPERNPSGETVSEGTAWKQTVDQLEEHCASGYYPCRGSKLILAWRMFSFLSSEHSRNQASSTARRIASTCPDMRWNYTPASLQARPKRFNKTSRTSELSTESAASWEEDSRSSPTSGMKPTWSQRSQVKNSLSQQKAKIQS